MARTIRTKVYRFEELSKEAQQKAIDNYRNDGIETDHIYDEMHETVKAFNDLFGTEEGRNSWLDVRTGHIDDNICQLKGLRLRTYIINNFWSSLYKGRYYSVKGEITKRHPRIKKEWLPHSKKYFYAYYSAVQFTNDCPLTGVCYDHSILQPVYDLIERYKENQRYHDILTFEELMTECFYKARKAIEDEEEYLNSDEAIRELLEGQDDEYTKDGKRFL